VHAEPLCPARRGDVAAEIGVLRIGDVDHEETGRARSPEHIGEAARDGHTGRPLGDRAGTDEEGFIRLAHVSDLEPAHVARAALGRGEIGETAGDGEIVRAAGEVRARQGGMMWIGDIDDVHVLVTGQEVGMAAADGDREDPIGARVTGNPDG
jgi:hypothetical protein